MQYQLHQIDRSQLEKNFLGQNFKLVEKDACLFIKKGCQELWLYNILAVAYAKQKKFQLAEENFLKIIDLDPGDFDHYFNLANLYREIKEYNKCIKFLLLALKIKPRNIKALLLLSVIYYKIKDYQNNLSCLNLILSIDPLNTEALNNKSVLLVTIGKFQEALDCFLKIDELNVNGNNKNLMSDISACYIFLGDIANAKYFNNLAGKGIGTEYNNGIIQLILGNYHKGWKGYESGIHNKARVLRDGHEKFDELPEWKPGIHFDSVALIGEQGIGDEIMYSTIIGCLLKKVKNIYYFCDPRLIEVLKNRFPTINFLFKEKEYNIKKFQSKLAIGSLPRYFRGSEEDFSKVNLPNCNKNHKKPSRLKFPKHKKLIGISWHTNNKQFGPERNINLDLFSPILINKNYNFLNLQYGNHEIEIKKLEAKLNRELFLNYGNDNLNDISGLAANINKCDLVISIDNSTVHLSGFLNQDTFLLLPFVSDWRWQRTRSDTPWYKSVRLFRQSKRHDWSNVIQNVLEAIETA